MTYRIAIDRLVLDGLPVTRAQGPIVQAAVEAELSRLVTEGGLSAPFLTDGAYASLLPAAMSTDASESPAALGERIARSIYGGLGS